MKVEMTGRNEGCKGWTAVKRQPALRAKRFGVWNDSSAFGRQPESGAGARAPETAIQPGPVAVNTTRYKSIQVNITKKIRASSMQAHLPLAMSRKGGRQKNGGEKMSCSHLFAPIFLPIRARAGSPLQAGADEAG